MKKLSLVLALGVVAWVLPCGQAEAIPFFNKLFQEQFAGEKADPAFAALVKDTAKCNVCHVEGEKKTVRNEYGEALHKAGLEKAKFPTAKQMDEASKKEVLDAFEKVGAQKSAGGATFAEQIKAGKLPATK